jgi:hypothetical protein
MTSYSLARERMASTSIRMSLTKAPKPYAARSTSRKSALIAGSNFKLRHYPLLFKGDDFRHTDIRPAL